LNGVTEKALLYPDSVTKFSSKPCIASPLFNTSFGTLNPRNKVAAALIVDTLGSNNIFIPFGVRGNVISKQVVSNYIKVAKKSFYDKLN